MLTYLIAQSSVWAEGLPLPLDKPTGDISPQMSLLLSLKQNKAISFLYPSAAFPLDPSIKHVAWSSLFYVHWSDIVVSGDGLPVTWILPWQRRLTFWVNATGWGGRHRSESWAHMIVKEVTKYGAIKIILWGPQTIGTSLLWFMTFLAWWRMSALSWELRVIYCVSLPLRWLFQTGTLTPFRYSYIVTLVCCFCVMLSTSWGKKKEDRARKMCWCTCLSGTQQGLQFSKNFCACVAPILEGVLLGMQNRVCKFLQRSGWWWPMHYDASPNAGYEAQCYASGTLRQWC